MSRSFFNMACSFKNSTSSSRRAIRELQHKNQTMLSHKTATLAKCMLQYLYPCCIGCYDLPTGSLLFFIWVRRGRGETGEGRARGDCGCKYSVFLCDRLALVLDLEREVVLFILAWDPDEDPCQNVSTHIT